MVGEPYFSCLCKLMGFIDGTNYPYRTTPPFTQARLAAITPEQIVNYFCFRTYGKVEVTSEDVPLHWRLDSAQYHKKAISSFMPNHGEWNVTSNSGNPTRARIMLAFLARLQKHQTRRQGRPPQAKREMKVAEFKLAANMIQDSRWRNCMTLQMHLIGRGDDIHEMKTKNIHIHPTYDFCGETTVNWSKNVTEERDCPPQILIGSQDKDFCVLLDLAIYLEDRFETKGILGEYMYTEELDENAPKRSLNAYSRSVRDRVFKATRFLELSSLTAGSLGIHSIRKLPATHARSMGCLQDEIDLRGRWHRDRGSRISLSLIHI